MEHPLVAAGAVEDDAAEEGGEEEVVEADYEIVEEEADKAE